ncbi:MAG: hypothetical protein ACRC7O_12725 [Fimbriiglobus sp.]
MPSLVPNRFLVRVCHPCPHVPGAPQDDGDHLVDLPESARLQTFAALDGHADFADVRVGWNEIGLAVQVAVAGKRKDPAGDADRPGVADGITLWLDTRDARTSHRASRFCHQFHLLPAGGGPDKDEPAFAQTKINRAQQDAPVCQPADVAFRCHRGAGGYRLEAFLPAAVLAGYDPDQFPRLGVYYHVRDGELGDQFLGVSADFPFADDPSLWEPLELTGGKPRA